MLKLSLSDSSTVVPLLMLHCAFGVSHDSHVTVKIPNGYTISSHHRIIMVNKVPKLFGT